MTSLPNRVWSRLRSLAAAFAALHSRGRLGHRWHGKLLLAPQLTAVVLARRTVRDFVDDDCPHMAAAIAYYSLFSLFPLLLGLVAVLGFALGSTGLRDELIAWIGVYLPGSHELVTANVLRVVKAREEVGALAFFGFLWSASAVFGAVRKALNEAWDLDRSRPLLRQKLLDLGMVGSVGLLFVLSTSLTASYRLLGEWRLPLVDAQPFGHALTRGVVGMALPAVVTFALFLGIYKIVPFTKVAWSSAALGAGLADLLFELAKNLFVWYAQAFGRYELVYGSLGGVIGLLTWVYLSALILLLGAELAAEHGKMLRECEKRGLTVD